MGSDPREEEADDWLGFGEGVLGEGHHSHGEEVEVLMGQGEGGLVHQRFHGSVRCVGEAGELLGEPPLAFGDWAEVEEGDGLVVDGCDESTAVVEEIEGLGFDQEVQGRESAVF